MVVVQGLVYHPGDVAGPFGDGADLVGVVGGDEEFAAFLAGAVDAEVPLLVEGVVLQIIVAAGLVVRLVFEDLPQAGGAVGDVVGVGQVVGRAETGHGAEQGAEGHAHTDGLGMGAVVEGEMLGFADEESPEGLQALVPRSLGGDLVDEPGVERVVCRVRPAHEAHCRRPIGAQMFGLAGAHLQARGLQAHRGETRFRREGHGGRATGAPALVGDPQLEAQLPRAGADVVHELPPRIAQVGVPPVEHRQGADDPHPLALELL